MKKFIRIFQIGLIACLLCSLFMTSCNDKNPILDIGLAPKDVAGKTMTINGTSAGTIHITFYSNTSAGIKNNSGNYLSFSSISYNKTNANAATLLINGLQLNFGVVSSTDNENLSLIFTSSTQGVVNGFYSRRWNDGTTTSGSIEYQSFTIF